MNSLPEASTSVPILCNLLAAVLGAVGQLLYRKGSLALTSIPIWKNAALFLGCLCFCGVMILFVAGYRMGGKVSITYPFYATTFIWSTLIAYFVLNETIQPIQWLGILAITLGVAAVASGSGT